MCYTMTIGDSIMNKWDEVIQTIALHNRTTPQQVRRDMLTAMEVGQNHSDPAIRAKWESIPRKGEKLTLEEFLKYLFQASSGIS